MADSRDTEQLVIALEARIRDFERNFQKASATATKNFRAIEDRAAASAKRVEAAMASTSVVAMRAASGLGAALSTRELVHYADEWTNAGNRIAAVGIETDEVAATQIRLAEIARTSRADFGATVDLYAKLTGASGALGVSQEQVARAVETVNKALALGGTSASAAAGAITQLGQALASGTLRGDELNSILEASPQLAKLIADELGATIGELRSLGAEGKITAKAVFDALVKGSADIDAAFATTRATVGQALTNLNTSLVEYVGKLDAASGASGTLARGIGAVADNIDIVARAAAAAGFALTTVYAGRAIPAAVAATRALTVAIAANPFGALLVALTAVGSALVLFSDEIRPVQGELATLGDYGATAFDAISQAATSAAAGLADDFIAAVNLISQAMTGTEVTWADVVDFLGATVDRLVGTFVAAHDVISAVFTGLGSAMAEGVVGAVNVAIKAIEGLINKAVDGLNTLIGTVNDVGGVIGLEVSPVGKIDLGTITNPFEGAAEKLAGEIRRAVEQASRPWVTGALRSWRDAANDRARSRLDEDRERRIAEAKRATGDAAGAAAPQVNQLADALRNAGTSAGAGTSGIKTFGDAIRALQGEIPELAAGLADLDAKMRIEGVYDAAVAKATTMGQVYEAIRLRDAALAALAGKPAREAAKGGMLDLIGFAEGTEKGRGYNETLGYGKFTGGDRNLVVMTLDQVDTLQGQMLADPANTFNSSALGRYQITRRTLRGLRDTLGLRGDELFDPAMQDRLAEELLRQRGNDPAALRNEWEGLRRIDDQTIRTAYDGTSATLGNIDPGLKEQAVAYDQIVASARQFVAEQGNEQRALGMTQQQAAALHYEQQMLTEAQQANVTLTPQQRTEITQLAQAMAQAETATQRATDAQRQMQEAGRFFGQQITSAFSSIVTGASSVEDALGRIASAIADAVIQAALLGDGPLGGLFGGGLLAAIFGFADGGVVHAATGGLIRGPGTGTSDSIPARLSDGEFVVNARATARNRDLLEAINDGEDVESVAPGGPGMEGGSRPRPDMAPDEVANRVPPAGAANRTNPRRALLPAPRTELARTGHVRGLGSSTSDSILAALSDGEFVVNARATARHRHLLEAINAGEIPGFATGGLVGARALPALSVTTGSTTNRVPTVNAPISIKVEGGSQGPEADEKLAKRIGKEVEGSLRKLVVGELMNQTRPGGLLRQR